MPLTNCPECGNQVSTAAQECPACGSPLTPILAVRARPVNRPTRQHITISSNPVLPTGMSFAGMICGVSGTVILFVPCLWIVGIVPSVLGIIISGLALSKIRREEQGGWGLAVAGMITGLISLLCYMALWISLQGALHKAFS